MYKNVYRTKYGLLQNRKYKAGVKSSLIYSTNKLKLIDLPFSSLILGITCALDFFLFFSGLFSICEPLDKGK